MARPTSTTPQVVRFGVFELDLQAGELRKNGAKVRLEGQPLTILTLLVERRGLIVTREELRQKLWPADTFVDFEHSINVAVKRLREAVQDSATVPRFIETLPRRGYRFIYPVQSANGVSAEPQADEPRPVPRRWPLAAGLALALVVLAVLALRGRIFAPRLHVPVESVAVLPFKNLTGSEQQEFLADGITDALTTEVSRAKKLHVPSVTSTMHYGHAQLPLAEIASKLGVEAAVEGSVQQRSGGELVLNIQLIDALKDRHLWANSYNCNAANLQSTLRAIARDLLQQMKVPLSNQELALLKAEPSANPQAVEAFLKGRYHLRRGTEQDRLQARDLLYRAIELDPSYAAPYAQLAVLFAHGGAYLAGTNPMEGRAQTRTYANKALDLDPTLADAHRALAWVAAEEWDWAGAEREYLTARELGPNDASAWYAQFLGEMRRFDEAIAEAERVIRLDPASPDVVTHAAYPYFQAGRVENAIRFWQQCLELDPNYWAAHNFLGRAYIKQGRYAEGIAEVEKSDQLRGSSNSNQMDAAIVAYAYVRWGKREQGERILKDLEKAGAAPFNLLFALVGRRDYDRAFQLLESRVEKRGAVLAYISSEPLYEELYLDPRYIPLMRRIGFPEAAVQNAVASARRNATVKTAQAR